MRRAAATALAAHPDQKVTDALLAIMTAASAKKQ
jgi:hypothetical protein